MSFDSEFISNSAPAALLAISGTELLANARSLLTQCGYKVRAASNHEDFISRVTRTRYEVVVIEETFASEGIEENASLYALQQMSMNERRGTSVILLGPSFQTLNPLQAFQQSVHAALNPEELESLGPIAQQAVTNNGLFNEVFLSTEQRLATGAAYPAPAV
ncbi:MAG: hypothetical protein MJA27_22315 [Pseudanabaenales cyanobacterium]|nr:hypothetical protein [Pseudanabaenales cyanobacterium]